MVIASLKRRIAYLVLTLIACRLGRSHDLVCKVGCNYKHMYNPGSNEGVASGSLMDTQTKRLPVFTKNKVDPISKGTSSP